MNVPVLRAYLLAAVAASLSGCAADNATPQAPLGPGSQSAASGVPLAIGSPLGPSVARFAVAALPRKNPARSWMEPGAKNAALLYVSDYTAGDVAVFSYPAGKPVGTITGLDLPQGLCSDRAGNVWVTNSGTQEIIEYAHGGTAPIARLSDPGFYPTGCSVDPKTGNLAVANIEGTKHAFQGDVAIYAGARGTPAYFTPENLYTDYFVGYDGTGDLFVDGTNAEVGANGTFEFAELSKNASTFTPLTLSGGSVAFPGAVQWDGKQMTVGDQANAVVYQLDGSAISGSTPLTGSSDVVQYSIDKKMLVGADAGAPDVAFFAYPSGGTARLVLTGLSEPVGSAISR